MDELSADHPSPREDPAAPAERLARELSVEPPTAELLVAAGYTSPSEVRALSDAALREIGLEAEEIERLRAAGSSTGADRTAAGKVVERWLGSVHRSERPKRRVIHLPAKDSTDALRKWVDGDDRALEAWIQSGEGARGPPAPPSPGPPPTRTTLPVRESPPAAIAEPGPASAGSGLPNQLVEREETVVRWLAALLDRVKSDRFEPGQILQEVQELQRQLFDEKARRKQLEDELEHVKRGSIAVIKYVRSREAKGREQAIQEKEAEIAELKLKLLGLEGTAGSGADAAAPARPAGPGPSAEAAVREAESRLRESFEQREQGYLEREAELRRRIVQVEAELRTLRADNMTMRQREESRGRPERDLATEAGRRLTELESREKELVVRENALRAKFEEIRINAEGTERDRTSFESRRAELGGWEQELTALKQSLEVEARRLGQVRTEVQQASEAGSPAQSARIAELEQQLREKTRETTAKEVLLREQMGVSADLRSRLESLDVGPPAAAGAADSSGRIHSGIRRLDDLLYGGYPPAAQVLVNGPAHTGKDTLTRLFMAEGLKGGAGALWVLTDKTFMQVREEMTALLPNYAQLENDGRVRYVDLYSRSVGITQGDAHIRLLNTQEKNVLDQLGQAINGCATELKEHGGSYRLAFESVSTLTAWLDAAAMFRFLQPLTGRRRIDGAAAYYLLETGMHSESDLETLEHMMDGSVNLKIDQLKTFLAIRGVGEVQSRAWIGYGFSKKAFNLGSFSLDHIR